MPFIGGASYSTGGCPLPIALVRSTERGKETILSKPSFLEFPETGKAQWRPQNLLAVLPPLCAERGHMVWGCLQLAGAWFDLFLSFLIKKHGSWIY